MHYIADYADSNGINIIAFQPHKRSAAAPTAPVFRTPQLRKSVFRNPHKKLSAPQIKEGSFLVNTKIQGRSFLNLPYPGASDRSREELHI